MRPVLYLLLGSLATLFLARAGSGPTTKPSRRKPPSAEVQAERLQLLKELQARGIFATWANDRGEARVYVGRAFRELTPEQQRKFLSVVYALFFDGPDADSSAARAIRDLDGRKIGVYGPAPGGLKMK